MVRRLLANWELKLLSVVIAFALWLVVVGGGKSQLAVAAVVEYTGLDGDLVLVGRPRDTVDVELEAARWAVTRLTPGDRKSTRLNSSHGSISYAVFCLKKKIRSS